MTLIGLQITDIDRLLWSNRQLVNAFIEHYDARYPDTIIIRTIGYIIITSESVHKYCKLISVSQQLRGNINV